MQTSSAQGATGSTFDDIRHHADSGSLAERLDFEFWHSVRTIFRVAESPFLVLDAITFAVAVSVISVALWKGWFRLHRWCWPALAVVAALCVVTPPSLFGVGYVSDRLPLVFALLLIAALASSRPLPRGGQRSEEHQSEL